jgi:hypothetical protein
MEISSSHLAATFSNAAFAYLILAAQLCMGFPPFYKSLRPLIFGELGPGGERLVKRLIPIVAGIIVMAVVWVATGISLFYLAAGIIAACGALWLRRDLYKTTGGTLVWMVHPWTVRWPMLVFDLWTLGIASLFGLITL